MNEMLIAGAAYALSKAGVKLFEVLEKLGTGIMAPNLKVKNAEADEQVALIEQRKRFQLALNEQQFINERAFQGFVNQVKQQHQNKEEIAEAALKDLKEDAKPEEIEPDWIANFLNKCQDTSNKEKQKIWGKVLAMEANKPGSFSIRAINALNDLDLKEIESLRKLFNFVWWPPKQPVILSQTDSIYVDHGVTFELLTHLEIIGFIRLESSPSLGVLNVGTNVYAAYAGRVLSLRIENIEQGLKIGHCMFTNLAKELIPVLDLKTVPVEGFFDYVKNAWMNHKPVEETPIVLNVSMDGSADAKNESFSK